MYLAWLAILLLSTAGWAQDEDDGPYRGKLLGKLNSYHHQVTGEVYAVDDWTLLLVNFNYDGTGDDTFFWAGDSARPGPQGFIVPDEHGKTNILERYYNAAVRLALPEGKRVSRLKWLAVYDIASQNAFGDVYVPDEFEAPAPQTAGALAGSGVSSGTLQLLDAKTILVPEFRYDGAGGEAYFWAGAGPQPSARGFKLPDEYGYLEPLPAYRGADVRLTLPGAHTLFTVSWLAVWDAAARRALASVLLPERPNVPPALTALHPHRSTLPSCRQLHRDLQVSWEVFGNQLTIQLAGKIGDNEYMAFGISGSAQRSQMEGADVAVASFDRTYQRGRATDYNITALAPCVQVLGQWRGVCRDERLGALDSNQVFTASRTDGVTVVTYRRALQPSEPIDREWVTDKPMFVVWAVGALDSEDEPTFHRLWPRADVTLNISQETSQAGGDDCVEFSVGSTASPGAWETAELFDPALRVFTFALGPAGGARGVSARGGGGAPLAWYVNGQLAPDIQIRRGLHYTFKVFGGNNPHSAHEYHPLIVSVAPRGGLEQLPEAAQRAVRVLAGVHYTRRGRLTATAAGPLCLASHAAGADPRRAADFATFRAYNRSLQWTCSPGAPAELPVAPNDTWPDLVYYNSFTHAGEPAPHTIHSYNRSLQWTCSPRAPAELPVAPNDTWPDLVYYNSFTHAGEPAPHTIHSYNRSLQWTCSPRAPAELPVAPNDTWPDLVYYNSFTHVGEPAPHTIHSYNRSLQWTCSPGAPAELPVAPNDTWPDLVYYNSFTHAGMGGRIFVVDRPKRNLNKKGNSAAAAGSSLVLLLIGALLAGARLCAQY
ncbi:protein Skeletor, isoforms B/C [Leguminivora glycinivorella]|uniref:protein Skeletor, isoforms B/C n=1 Tax=Leguminivora glycinivorella TaxID=1035111 RepID=UPI00200EE259|nr:protein Skeletor, isoforms B/C [Leguminivora glycinivorella]